VDAKLEHYASAVTFHSPCADIENEADLFIGFAIGQEAEDLSFVRAWTACERIRLIRRTW
jgi:hypothetical protein